MIVTIATKIFTSGAAGREVANFSALSQASLGIYTGVGFERRAASHIKFRSQVNQRWEFANNPWHLTHPGAVTQYLPPR